VPCCRDIWERYERSAKMYRMRHLFRTPTTIFTQCVSENNCLLCSAASRDKKPAKGFAHCLYPSIRFVAFLMIKGLEMSENLKIRLAVKDDCSEIHRLIQVAIHFYLNLTCHLKIFLLLVPCTQNKKYYSKPA
jgi:hypothetical protein